MDYIQKNLLPNEEILFRTKKSLIIFWPLFALLCCAVFLMTPNKITATINSAFSILQHGDMIARLPLIIVLLACLITGFQTWLTYVTSDYVVTNMRVLMKEGFFDRYMTNTLLRTISHVTVEQSLLGQILDYGFISLNNFGGAADRFALVSHPGKFQRVVQTQLQNR